MFGETIRSLREANVFSQEFVAEKLGMSQAAYSKYENNLCNLSAEIVKKLAIIFNVNPADILTNQVAIVSGGRTIIGKQGFAHADIVYDYPKEFADKIINSKDEEIARLMQDKEQLKSIINALFKDKEQLMVLLKGKSS